MGFQIIKDEKIYFGGYNLTPSVGGFTLEGNVEVQDDTTLGDSTRSNIAGLKTVSMQIEGKWDGTPYDAALYGALSLDEKPLSLSNTGVVGQSAYFFNALIGDYTPAGGSVGDIKEYSAGAVTKSKLIRGIMLLNATALTASAAGTAYLLAATSSTQKLYIATHMTAFNNGADTFAVDIESNATGTFSGSQTVRATITPSTALNGIWTEVSGPITDTYYRPNYTITGSTPSYGVTIFIGIG